MQKIIKITILIIFIFIIGTFFISLNKSANYNTEFLIGKKISKINLEYFNGKKIYNEEDLKKNDYTLINFWASWCTPCLYEHPYLLKLHKEKNITILGINYKDKKKNALKFLNDNGNPYHFLAKDHSGKQSINFGIYGIPESILLDRNLIIIEKFIGPISKEDFEHIKKIIKKI